MYDDNRNAALEGLIAGVLIFYVFVLAWKLASLFFEFITWFIPWFFSELRRYYRMIREWDKERRRKARVWKAKAEEAKNRAFAVLYWKVGQELEQEALSMNRAFDWNQFRDQFEEDYSNFSYQQLRYHLRRLYGINGKEQIRSLYSALMNL